MQKAQIVEVVTGPSMAQLVADRDRATGDVVELRLDLVDAPDVQGALEGRKKPVIVTCRAAWEGGGFAGSEEDRIDLLAEAVAYGAEFVDIEARADRRRLPTLGDTRLIVSFHDFSGFPDDLDSRVASMRSSPHDIVKVAVTASRLRDCVRLRDLMASDLPHIAIAMGGAGQLTRLFPTAFGSLFTYGGKTAPGQVSAADLRDVFRVPAQTNATKLYGVAGFPLKHSASPAMHNPALASCGIDGVYVPFETADAADLLAVADAFGVQGLSVTAPLKTDTYARVSSADPVAREIGAINTLRPVADGWEGRNFDVAGFLSPFDQASRDLSFQRAVVLGAGGAARTAVWALRSRGAKVSVSARNAAKARVLANEFGTDLGPWPPEPGWNLLVNTTPVGTWPASSDMPIDATAVRGDCVYDLIYNPTETALLHAARASGAETIGGLEMLVGQACLQFEWWTGQPAPRAIMFRAAEAFVARAQAQ
jgi:3-dehydroquinate dehydratase / shikimate dehydrogenase